MKTNKSTIISHIILLFALTACGGGSSPPPENDVVMFKELGYNPIETQTGYPKTEIEALSNERGILAQRGIFVKIEMCGNWKELQTEVTSVRYSITVSETQASLVKSIGYEKYTEDEKWTRRTCQ
ncbi:MAG: hypothetical protein IPH35_07470 [Rhodoferax sp.]|nr:hypothetical protein [Rhodoferax sp.]